MYIISDKQRRFQLFFFIAQNSSQMVVSGCGSVWKDDGYDIPANFTLAVILNALLKQNFYAHY